MPSIKNLFGFRKNKGLDKSIIQKNPYRNNTDLNKRQFIKKGLLGMAGLGGLALASKVAKAGGLVFNDGSTQAAAGNKTIFLLPQEDDGSSSVPAQLGSPHIHTVSMPDAATSYCETTWTVPDDFTSLTSLTFHFTTTGTNMNNAYLGFLSTTFADGEAIAADSDSIGTTTYAEIAVNNGRVDIDVTAAANALTWTPGDIFGTAVDRQGGHANDTLSRGLSVLGWTLVYK